LKTSLGRHPCEHLLPATEGLLADPKLPTHLTDRGPVLRLLQRQGDLLIRNWTLPHGLIFAFQRRKITPGLDQDSGVGSSECVP
jgi:hypothetical protein